MTKKIKIILISILFTLFLFCLFFSNYCFKRVSADTSESNTDFYFFDGANIILEDFDSDYSTTESNVFLGFRLAISNTFINNNIIDTINVSFVDSNNCFFYYNSTYVSTLTLSSSNFSVSSQYSNLSLYNIRVRTAFRNDVILTAELIYHTSNNPTTRSILIRSVSRSIEFVYNAMMSDATLSEDVREVYSDLETKIANGTHINTVSISFCNINGDRLYSVILLSGSSLSQNMLNSLEEIKVANDINFWSVDKEIEFNIRINFNSSYVFYGITSAYISSKYTNVLIDLNNCSNFVQTAFTCNNFLFSLEIITISESVDGDLFIYCHCPCNDIKYKATYISLATTSDFENSCLYDLVPLSYEFTNNGFFSKYKVHSFRIGSESIRTYYIASVLRSWISGIDEEAPLDNTISNVPFEVGREFTFTNNTLSVKDIEIIKITDKFVGFIRYYGGYFFYNESSCDSYFVAFNTDRDIDDLLEADVFFKTQYVSYYTNYDIWSDKTFFGNVEESKVSLFSDEKTGYTGFGLLGSQYNWSRIQDKNGFFNSIGTTDVYSSPLFNIICEYEIDSDVRSELENKQWFLRFYDSSYDITYNCITPFGHANQIRRTYVSDVSILRLKFETDCVVYNLGVVDNMQTGSSEPINTYKITITLGWLLKLILIILFLSLLCLFIICIYKKIRNIKQFIEKIEKDKKGDKKNGKK